MLSGWGSGPGGLGDSGKQWTLQRESVWPTHPAQAWMLGANPHGPCVAQEAGPGGVSPQHQPSTKWRILPENQPPLTFQEPSLVLHRVETLLWHPSTLPIKSQPRSVATKCCEGLPCPPTTTLLTLPFQPGHALPLCLGYFLSVVSTSSSSVPPLRPPAWPPPAFLPQKPDHVASNPMTMGAV